MSEPTLREAAEQALEALDNYADADCVNGAYVPNRAMSAAAVLEQALANHPEIPEGSAAELLRCLQGVLLNYGPVDEEEAEHYGAAYALRVTAEELAAIKAAIAKAEGW